jgi:stage III sporulation protein AD
MIVVKIIFVAIVSIIAFSYLKTANSELSLFVILGGGIVILIMIFSHLLSVVDFFKELAVNLQIDVKIIELIVKLTAITYVIEFTVNLCEDVGAKSLASKVGFAGRVILFTLSIPVIKNLFDVVLSFVI